MPQFLYEATNIAGARVAGEISAGDQETALKLLERRSLTEIQLEEIAPPPAPMPLSRKLWIAAIVMGVLLGVSYGVVRKALAPPDLEKVYAEIDQAVRDDNIEAQFQHYAQDCIMEDTTTNRTFTLAEVVAYTRDQIENEKLVRNRTTEVKEIKHQGDECLVYLNQSMFLGNKGTLRADHLKSPFLHVWKRDGLNWRIVRLKRLPFEEK